MRFAVGPWHEIPAVAGVTDCAEVGVALTFAT